MIGIAQLLLVVAAGALWMAARLPWVVIGSFDELGPPKEVTLTGASWSTALLPLALLMLAAASFAVGYLGISLWVVPDVAARGADLAHVPVVTLVGSARHYWGAVAAVLAAVCALLAAVFLMSSAAIRGSAGEDMARYAAPRARRSIARRQHSNAAGRAAPQDDGPDMGPRMSERMIWEALDEGRDPTDREQESDTEGR